jgi:hypothetical protein
MASTVTSTRPSTNGGIARATDENTVTARSNNEFGLLAARYPSGTARRTAISSASPAIDRVGMSAWLIM